MTEDLVLFERQCAGREECIRRMAKTLLAAGRITDLEQYIEAVMERERIGVTGIGMQVAIPHGKSKAVKKASLVFARYQEGVDFRAVDGSLARLIFLIAVPDTAAEFTVRRRRMKIAAITSCSTGIAHTYMAAEKLQMEAEAMGHEIKVETQGSIGAENVLTEEDIRQADAVLIAASTLNAGFLGALIGGLAKDKYTVDERESGKTAWVLGASFISEGAIPFAAADPIRVLFSVTIGSAITGALSMVFHCGLAVPHGGVFVLLIPGAVSNLLMYIVSIAVGTVISAVIVSVIKKKI